MKDQKPFTEERPWGWFREFSKNENTTVKLIFVKGGESLSLQKHGKRSEFWRVVSGNPEITIGEKIISAAPGDEFEIPVGENHRIAAPAGDIEILEVARGEFDENDIVRLEDKYGRA